MLDLPALRGAFGLRYSATTTQLILAASAFWMLALNRPFFLAALRTQTNGGAALWSFVVAMAVAMLALHVLLLGLVGTRHSLKPLLALLTLANVIG